MTSLLITTRSHGVLKRLSLFGKAVSYGYRCPIYRGFIPWAVLIVFIAWNGTLWANPVVHHGLHVELFPDNRGVHVKDTLTVPDILLSNTREFEFKLGAWLKMSSDVIHLPADENSPEVRRYRVKLPADVNRVGLEYQAIPGGLNSDGERQNRISGQGVFLDHGSDWYPAIGNELLTFSMRISLPEGWRGVSQGSRQRHPQFDVWTESNPQDNIYLIANRFHEFDRPLPDGRQAMAFLRSDDPELSQRYLDVTGHYLEFYSKLLGPYPYQKFALVENDRETGFGMPSFTLLGPQVIRLPFIIHTSYPHEILHNWWGNGVYVDYRGGNWSEGLTAYLADYLFKEQREGGVDYRRNALQKYTNYVRKGLDFPLSEFMSRHSQATQAVGYNKTLMFFHMLRQKLGDQAFINALRQFYHDYRFSFADYNDLKQAFEAASKLDLNRLFEQWINRTGAPQIAIIEPRVLRQDGQYLLEATLEQTQASAAYELDVPLAVTLEKDEQAAVTLIEMREKQQRIKLIFPAKPLLLEADPDFDLFRRLDRAEMPASLGQLFGAAEVTVLVPSKAAEPLRKRYIEFADQLKDSMSSMDIQLDTAVKQLPQDRALLVLGWENTQIDKVRGALKGYSVSLSHNTAGIGGGTFRSDQYSIVAVTQNPQNREMPIVWLGAGSQTNLLTLARKLPHYGKYSYLVFTDAPTSIHTKGQWPVLRSPLRVVLDPSSDLISSGKRRERLPLARFGIE